MIRSLAVVVLALLLRLGVLGYASRLPLFEHHRLDEGVYHELGRRVASGDLALGPGVLHMSPGYSYFIGAVYALAGDGPWPIRVAQLALGLGIVALVMASARRLAGEPWGTIAGVVAALYGPLAFYETLLLATALSAFAHALLLLLALRAMERASLARWLGVGLALGLAVIVRPNALLLLLPLALAAWRAAPRFALVLGLATASLVAPITLRNLVVAGEPVLVTDAGGLNFFIGNGKGAIGTFRIPRDVPDAANAELQFPAFRAVAERYEQRALSSREVDAFWYRTSWARIRHDPAGWLRLMAYKLSLYWNARELPSTEDYAFTRLVNPVLALPLVGFGVLAPFALLGTLLLLAGSPRERLLGWMNVLACIGVVLFFVLGHYRLPAIPGLIVAAAFGLRRLHEAARAAPSRRAALSYAVLVAAIGLAFVRVALPDGTADQWFKLGYAYHVEHRLEEAARCYERARALDPSNLSATKNLALLYETLDRAADARAMWSELARAALDAGNSEYERLAREHLAHSDVSSNAGPSPAKGADERQ